MQLQFPERMESDGRFPFGKENGPRPVRAAASGAARQVIMGTYPSALHVGWRAPSFLTLPAGVTGKVASLAVDVEPMVFWDGSDSDEHVDRWVREVGFVEGDDRGCHGHLTRATNGPTGDALNDQYFVRLPFQPKDTAYLDVAPVFFVKQGTPSQRGQGDVMEHEYNALAPDLGLPTATLPPRPTPATLPSLAVERFGAWLTSMVRSLEPAHVVTLGEEALSVLNALIDESASDPIPSLQQARSTNCYGAVVPRHVDGHAVDVTPLAHPAAIRQSQGKAGGWAETHAAWRPT